MTVQRFKAWLRSQGKTIRQWAEENDFPPSAVYRVLNGVDKANFGRAHDIAVKAGIKGKEVSADSTSSQTESHQRVAA
ncbi:DNA-binding protein [Chromobacterium violaceum]|uniref:DNA-binding protein n=1 Tax=Chromobacterium violaceum TaxID=536 RepID=UPI00068E70A1|nr:DNA-binding protein [Chromobacterium violaceum]MBP4049206.1 DNA-binding protein [Chromobacterium violaceum]